MDNEFYEKGGKKYDRVTTVLDYFQHPSLVKWKLRVGDVEAKKISKEALKIGGRVDKLCEQDIKECAYKILKSDDEKVRSAMMAWELWKREWPDHFADIEATQQTVYFDDWMVAGTCDFLGKSRLISLKTSRQIASNYWIQDAVYNRKFQRKEIWVLDVSKYVGDYTYEKCEYPQEYLENLFVGRLINYRFQKEYEDDSDI